MLTQPCRLQGQAPVPIPTQTHDQEARSLFADILGESVNPDSKDYLSKVASNLDGILIERENGDITRNVHRLFGSSIFEVAFQLLRYSIYLSSNNWLSDNHTDKLVKWVVRNGQFAAIERLVKMKRATTKIFASNMLLSAVRLQDTTTVRVLIALETDVNIPGGSYPKKTALWMAVSQIVSQINWRGRYWFLNLPNPSEFSLVRLLLDAGADINAKSGPDNTSPLQEAISGENVELVQVLLNATTIVDTPMNEQEFLVADLLKAARDGHSKLLETLLNVRARACPTQTSMISLLQEAAKKRDIDTVQSLLDAGADFDAPAGIRYKVAREKAVRSNRLWHLQSPIQISASKGATEMVQVLLEAGAHVDGYAFTKEEYLLFENTQPDDSGDREKQYDDEDDDDHRGEDDSVEEDDSDEEGANDYIKREPSYWTPLQSAVAPCLYECYCLPVRISKGKALDQHHCNFLHFRMT